MLYILAVRNITIYGVNGIIRIDVISRGGGECSEENR